MEKQIFTSFTVEELKCTIKDCIKDVLKEERKNVSDKSNDEELLNIEAVQKMLGVSKVTIHKWKKKGLIPFYKINRKLYFKKSELLNVFQNRNRKLM